MESSRGQHGPRTRHQFTIRRLLFLTLLLAVVLGYFRAVRNKQESRERLREELDSYGVLIDYGRSRVTFARGQITGDQFEALLSKISQVADVRSVYLDRTQLDDSALRHLQLLGEHLRTVSLEDMEVTDDGVAHLARLDKLAYVSLANTAVTDAGVMHLRQRSTLISLNLAGTNVTDAGLLYLTELGSLTRLTLDRTPVSDGGLAYVAKLEDLRELSLNDTTVSNRGLEQLKTLKHLEELFLQGTHVTDAGLQYLTKLKDLQYVDVRRTRVTAKGVDAVQGELRDTSFFYDGGDVWDR